MTNTLTSSSLHNKGLGCTLIYALNAELIMAVIHVTKLATSVGFFPAINLNKEGCAFLFQLFLSKEDPKNRFFRRASIHLHVPEVGHDTHFA